MHQEHRDVGRQVHPMRGGRALGCRLKHIDDVQSRHRNRFVPHGGEPDVGVGKSFHSAA